MILPSAAPATRASPLSMTARTRERIYRPGDLVVVDVLVFRSPSSSDGESTNASKPLPLEVAVRAAGVMRVDTVAFREFHVRDRIESQRVLVFSLEGVHCGAQRCSFRQFLNGLGMHEIQDEEQADGDATEGELSIKELRDKLLEYVASLAGKLFQRGGQQVPRRSTIAS